MFVCEACGMVLDRDHNAASNLLLEALRKELLSVRQEVTPVEWKALAVSMEPVKLPTLKQEPTSI